MRLEKQNFRSVDEYEGYIEAGKTYPYPTSSTPDYFRGWRIMDTERNGNTIMFEVMAGTRNKDTGKEARKMLHFHASAPHALQEYYDLQRLYDWIRLDLVVEQNGIESRRNILGGHNKEQS